MHTKEGMSQEDKQTERWVQSHSRSNITTLFTAVTMYLEEQILYYVTIVTYSIQHRS